MRQSNLIVFSLVLATILIQLVLADLVPTEVEGNAQQQSVEGHHRTKRSPYDPLIPALLLGKSAFLLGTVLGPQLFHGYHRRPHYHRSFHGGFRGQGHGYNRGWGWK